MSHPPVRVVPDRGLIAVSDVPLETRELQLGGTPRGAVLILCDVDELDGWAVEALNALAEHGYEGIAASIAAGPDEAYETGVVESLAERLAHRGWSRQQIGLLGHGGGGRAVLEAASGPPVGVIAAVEPDGVVQAAGRTWRSSSAVLVIVAGDAVDGTAAAVDRFADALGRESPAATEVVRYPGVRSGFFSDPVDGPARAAAFEGWQRIVESFDGHVAPRTTRRARAWALAHPHPDSDVVDLATTADGHG